MDLNTQLQQLIDMAYAEDGEKDITSAAICTENDEKEAVIVAKQDGIICGLSFIEQILAPVDESLVFEPFLEEGDPIKQRMMVGALTGPVKSLLRVERVLINFLSRLSGIATTTHEFLQAIEGSHAMILDTRKTVPGWRFLDKFAVKTAGAINHRMSLEDVAMIKDTHVDACGGVVEAIQRFRSQDTETPLIVEVRDLEELKQALEHVKSLTRVMLDNFSLEDLRAAVELTSNKTLLEASGNITLENAREIAETGVHFLSIGSLTHSPRAFDLSLQIS